MAAVRLARGPSIPLSRPRRAIRKIVPVLFATGLVYAGFITVRPEHPPAIPSKFSHTYPANPAQVERPKVVGPPPVVRRGAVLQRGHISTMDRLAHVLPRGTIRRMGSSTWVLAKPIAVSGKASVTLRGPATLEIAPGAYVESTYGGSLVLRGLNIVAVGGDGTRSLTASADRGFVLTYQGRLVLDHVHASSLGHLGVLAYGISFHKPLPGSGVIDSVITGNYIGVYTTHARNVHILRDRFLHSQVYGIDPHTSSSNLTIEANQVIDSGLHGIILADRVTGCRVLGNVVQGSRDHGIVLFDHSDGNLVANNQVLNAFDGIVLTDSSSNRIVHNIVDSPRRFGLRMSGVSNHNVVEDNRFVASMVGAYVYSGPTGNSFLHNSFEANYEDIRVRSDAPGNRVFPVPLRHELVAP